MTISVTETIELACSPAEAFNHTNEAENLKSFVGYGPIPGIREARYLTPAPLAIGSRRSVLKTDGTTHIEEIIEFVPGRRHVTRIFGLSGFFGLIVRDLQDVWEFEPVSDHTTRVKRAFLVEPRTLAIPVALLLVPLMRRAVQRDLRNTAATIKAGR